MPKMRDQSLTVSTAADHSARRRERSSSGIVGRNSLSSSQPPSTSSSVHRPTASPASRAAPRAVDSMTFGRSTRTPVTSARKRQRKLLALAPPSTLIDAMGLPASAAIAERTSQAWKAMDSRTARARWFLLVPLVRPMIIPRAPWSQCGAPSPENAGTTMHPAVSGTLSAMASVSPDSSTMPSSSLSHCTAAPAM